MSSTSEPSARQGASAPATRSSYFDELYSSTPDPWGLAVRFYEQRKRQIVLASLPRRRFRRVFEPGCATGLLTRELVTRCDELLAWDVADAALRQTTQRLSCVPHDSVVTVAHGRIPGDWPSGYFDLVMLSEVSYYCESLDDLRERVIGSLADDGVVVACDWLHDAVDHPRRGADVHRVLGLDLHRSVHHLEADFQLDVWSRDRRSVAEMDGIL